MPRRSRARARGFTLVEMMVAVLIGGISVVMAAKIAETVMHQNAKGRARTDFSARSRLLGHQLRSDIRLAGMGSTGAVAVDNVPPWSMLGDPTVTGRFPAIPVVNGVNNAVGVTIAGVAVQPTSDIVQLLVPNPGSLQRTIDRSAAGTRILQVRDATRFPVGASCRLIYIVDHTSPAGAGRTQVTFNRGGVGQALNISDNLQFTVAPTSDVMCARHSTYWVDTNGGLHRTDLTNGTAMQQIQGFVWVDIDGTGNDLVAPGALDLQIAYRVSKQVYELTPRTNPTNDPNMQWVFAGNGLNPNARMNTLDAWYEVRLIRLNLLGRTTRKASESNTTRAVGAQEDGPQRQLQRNLDAEWITTTESLVNLRYFDLGAPSNVPAEPY